MTAPDTSILAAIAQDFDDLASAGDAARLLVRLMLAALLGGLLGLDRERRGKAAGVRTHMLVATGSALFVLAPAWAGMSVADLSRVIQGVITGIGFIGAGAILKQRDDATIRGLTTAAGIWTTCAIGIACGLGMGVSAVVGAALAWLVLDLIRRLERGDSGQD